MADDIVILNNGRVLVDDTVEAPRRDGVDPHRHLDAFRGRVLIR